MTNTPTVKMSNGHAMIKCPGCDALHALNVTLADGRPAWKFNGDMVKPTFSPSLLVRTGHCIPGQPPAEECVHCLDARNDGHESHCGVCHSFIEDGQMRFLSDCTHALAGQTVKLQGDWITQP